MTYTYTSVSVSTEPEPPKEIIEQLNRVNTQINFLQSYLGDVVKSVNRLASVDEAQRPTAGTSFKGAKDPDTVTFRLQDIEGRLQDLVSTSELISNHLSKLV
jgi:hypothetical protein